MTTTDRQLQPASEGSSLGMPSVLARRRSLDFKVFLLIVFMVPVQIESGGLSRIAPSDILLAGLIVMTPGLIRVRGRAVDLLPLALMLTLTLGALVSLMSAGDLTNHSLFVKLAGSSVLALLAVTTATYARAGLIEPILRSFLSGLAFWAVIAYVDWKIFDIIPFLDSKITTRFGGMQFDPNNAGAAYAVAVVMTTIVGRRLFGNVAWAAVMACSLTALGVTLSRGGYISATIAAIVVIIVERPKMERGVRAAFGGLAVLIGATASGIIGTAVDDFGRRPDNIGGRNRFAQDGIDDFVSSGGLGVGLGTFRAKHGDIIHNSAIWLMVEMSLLGVALLIAMAVVPAVAALKIRRADRPMGNALLAGHVAMLVASLGIEALYQRAWWMIIGLIAGAAASESWQLPGFRRTVS